MFLQNVCPKAAATIMGGGRNTGGFAERFRGSGNLAVKIPDSMSPADAAPLLCAGITVWSPIKKYVTNPGMKVCSVYAVSTSALPRVCISLLLVYVFYPYTPLPGLALLCSATRPGMKVCIICAVKALPSFALILCPRFVILFNSMC